MLSCRLVLPADGLPELVITLDGLPAALFTMQVFPLRLLVDESLDVGALAGRTGAGEPTGPATTTVLP
jgi:hypothetical protein